MKLTILSKGDTQISEFRSFFGRIEDAINCFWDLLTFNSWNNSYFKDQNLKLEQWQMTVGNNKQEKIQKIQSILPAKFCIVGFSKKSARITFFSIQYSREF